MPGPLQYFQFLNQYFDKIFVVTIARATERQQQIKERLQGLNFEFFYGIDKQEHSMEAFTLNSSSIAALIWVCQ